MAQHSKGYIIGFSVAVCLVCSIIVSFSAVLLKDRQEINKTLKRQKKVLNVAGLLEEGAPAEAAKVNDLFEKNIKARIINLESGKYTKTDPSTFDQRKNRNDPTLGKAAPKNLAQVQRLPKEAVVYQVMDGDKVNLLILPIEGKGLWSTMYGYIALDKDTTSVKGITFYEHGETPGLGGEIDNPRWKALWKGRKAFDNKWNVKLEVMKGQALPASDKKGQFQVDGLSGATLTSRGVSHTIAFWLGKDGFGPYLKNFREGALDE